MSSRPTNISASPQHLSADFWKFWTGQTISSLGSSFTSFALPLLVFKLTNSPVNLAISGATSVIPYLLFGLIIGAWVDRVDRKRWMVMTDIGRAIMIATIPLLGLVGLLTVWWIYVVIFINATLAMGFDAANFAAIPSLVSQDNLVTANGRIQASYSTASVLGPLLAGVLLTILPVAQLLFFDACSFLLSASSLLLITTSFNNKANTQKKTSITQDIREGLSFVLHHPILRWLILMLLFINFVTPTVNIQIITFAKQWLRASDTQVGLLFSAGSVGIIIASLLAGLLHKRWSFSTLLLSMFVIQGPFILVLAFTHNYWLALALWMFFTATNALFNITSYSMGQAIIPNHLLGRTITFIRVLTWPTAAIGFLIGGVAIERTHSITLVYAVIGILTFGIAIAFWFTPLRMAQRYVIQRKEER